MAIYKSEKKNPWDIDTRFDNRSDPRKDPDMTEMAKEIADLKRQLDDIQKRKKGSTEKISIRIEDDILSALRSEGPGWQTRINDILRREVLGLDRPE